MQEHRVLKKICLAVSFGFWFLNAGLLHAADPAPWVELAADGKLAIRTIVAKGAQCPQATRNGDVKMQERTAVDGKGADNDPDFQIILCQGLAPATAVALTVSGMPVPTLPPTVNRIVLIGDTGCRLKAPDEYQDCNDMSAWPFATLARLAADKKPDLVIHVGDYYYRETCPKQAPRCNGSAHGDKWATWKLDFFDPAAPLLAAAPWVFVRGNHESCGPEGEPRGGKGWVRLLDPSPVLRECTKQTAPYALHLGGLELPVFDSSSADDRTADEQMRSVYREQLAHLLKVVPHHAWLATHRPFWALNDKGERITKTEYEAIRDLIPEQLDMVLSGHVHDFESYAFGSGRPAQLVVGGGGDQLHDLSPELKEALKPDGRPLKAIDGMELQNRPVALKEYGYFLLVRTQGGWDGTLYSVNDAVLARCLLRMRDIECRYGATGPQ
jgi:hypothetical protein